MSSEVFIEQERDERAGEKKTCEAYYVPSSMLRNLI